MALKTRIHLLAMTRIFIVVFACVIVLAVFGIAFASDSTSVTLSQVGALWQVIICLIGVLDLLLSSILVWIVGNQKETFQRMSKLEKGEDIRKEFVSKEVCTEKMKYNP
jgi:TRAP-type uncharacterized transport system fused permease subunit